MLSSEQMCIEALFNADIANVGAKVMNAIITKKTFTETITLFNGMKIVIDARPDSTGIMHVDCIEGAPRMMQDPEADYKRSYIEQGDL